MLAETQKMRAGIDSANQKLGSLEGTAKKAGAWIKNLAVGFVAFKGAQVLANQFKAAGAAVIEQDKLLAQTKSTLKSMGDAAGVTANDVLKMSDALERKSMIDAEQIQSGQNLLLTFGNIRNEAGKGNDVFNQTTQAMVDLSTAMGTSTQSSATMLGKALNDPVKGLSALSRVGVSFTSQQKEQVKALVESGNTMGAQKLILGELQKQYGGSGAAAAGTFAGKVKALKDTWDGFLETIVRTALPYLTKLVTFLADNLPGAIEKMRSISATLKPAFDGIKAAVEPVFKFLVENKTVVATFVGVILGIVAAVKVWTLVQAALNVVLTANPIGLIVVAIAALAAGLVYAYKKSETFRNIVNGAFSAIKAVVSTVLPPIVAVVKSVFGVVASYLRFQMAVIKTVISVAWRVVSTVTRVAFGLFKTFVIRPVAAVVAFIANAMGRAKSTISAAWTVAKTVTIAAFNRIKEAVVNAIARVVTTVTGLKNKIKGALSGAGELLYSVGKNVIQGLINGIKNMASSAVNAAKGVVSGAISGAKSLLGINSPSRVFAEIGKFTTLGLAKGLENSTALRKVSGASRAMTGAIETGYSSPQLAVANGGGVGGRIIEIRLSAEQADRVARGKQIAIDLAAYRKSGGRR